MKALHLASDGDGRVALYITISLQQWLLILSNALRYVCVYISLTALPIQFVCLFDIQAAPIGTSLEIQRLGGKISEVKSVGAAQTATTSETKESLSSSALASVFGHRDATYEMHSISRWRLPLLVLLHLFESLLLHLLWLYLMAIPTVIG
jgi:hypothetical protein